MALEEKAVSIRDEEMEQFFVNNFVVRNRRQRLLFELSGKKRIDGMMRFCHGTLKLIIKEKIIASGTDLYEKEILHIIRQHTNAENAYIMAYDEEIDACSCSVQEALEKVLSNGMAAIVIIDNVVVIETEQVRGTPERYILR